MVGNAEEELHQDRGLIRVQKVSDEERKDCSNG